MSEESQEAATVGRRNMLRRGGITLAGVAGASAAGLAAAPAAAATPGEPVVQGQSNDAVAAQTGLTSSSADGTLELANTHTANAAPLRLAPVADSSVLPNVQSRGGDVFNYDGDIAVTHAGADFGLEEPVIGFMYTTANASMTVPISPRRVLDTRSSSGRVNLVNPGTALDSQGRLKAGRSVKVKLTSYVSFGYGINCNLVAVTPTDPGFLSLVPEKPADAPESSSINYAKGAVVSNFAVAAIGFNEYDGSAGSISDYVYLYTHATTHIVLDATGFIVADPFQVNGFKVQNKASAPVAERQKQAAAYVARNR